MTSFFTSDTHFFHRNCIKYCPTTRGQFQDELEMNEALIIAWNNRVAAGDLVYHLGDFAFTNITKAVEILSRLNGRIVLIAGNHDVKLLKSPEFCNRFYNIEKSYYETKIDGTFVTMCHYPLVSWNGMSYGSFHLHGHTHGAYHHKGRGLDVGVDNREDLAPWTWQEICDYMETRPVKI